MYTVHIAEPARRDMQEQRDWWAEHRSAEQAIRWYAGFFRALVQLEVDPERFSQASEGDVWQFPIQQLHYGLGRRPTHRALFTIRSKEVTVLRVRYLAQDALSADDISAPE